MAERSSARAALTLLKNLTLAALLYASIYGIISLAGPTELIKTTKSGVQVKFAGTAKTVTINPHANVFNRPADLHMLFFADDEHRYYHLPDQPARASAQDPRRAEYVDADGHGNSLKSYVSVNDALAANASDVGTCPGPIIPYHVYWTGPATWRVEVFIKSYLDKNPNAVRNMMTKDALFARFLPLVERGDIDDQDKNGFGYYSSPGRPNADGEKALAENIVEDKNGQQWLVLTPKQMTFLPVAVSDAVRFIVLHIHGGAYFDMDVLMLRDMRPLLLPKEHAFAERWAAHPHPGDYNTAIMSLTANSSLSSYLLYGGIRMGVNFHPRVLGRMAWKDGRDQEFLMLETAAFDPIWTEFNWDREGRCTVPCLRDYGAAFRGKKGSLKDEWESYDGPRLEPIDLSAAPHKELRLRSHEDQEHVSASAAATPSKGEHADSFQATLDEEAELRKAGVIADYELEEDKFPPNNRTLENFFRGSWTYHIHNQWLKHPEPSSWISVLEHAQDGFFARSRTNIYGEKWTGPNLAPYNYWPEHV
ncbi:hypothetical protein ST47_g4705 [Ascochyta rabiei]|uniref:Transferase n=1 Tax=Didymella rabiei TaxID=5454 RepID=A0A163F5I2_DIDRA|nr:hypothetical protein ST47_g4705 [Ascochyta rabiei]